MTLVVEDVCIHNPITTRESIVCRHCGLELGSIYSKKQEFIDVQYNESWGHYKFDAYQLRPYCMSVYGNRRIMLDRDIYHNYKDIYRTILCHFDLKSYKKDIEYYYLKLIKKRDNITSKHKLARCRLYLIAILYIINEYNLPIRLDQFLAYVQQTPIHFTTLLLFQYLLALQITLPKPDITALYSNALSYFFTHERTKEKLKKANISLNTFKQMFNEVQLCVPKSIQSKSINPHKFVIGILYAKVKILAARIEGYILTQKDFSFMFDIPEYSLRDIFAHYIRPYNLEKLKQSWRKTTL